MGPSAATPAPPCRASRAPAAAPTPVVDEVPTSALKAEIDALSSTQRLLDHGRFHVYCARADAIPMILLEIGRLRELTFRSVGEGTGRCADIDRFDALYLHLFVWDTQAAAIVGAYRLGLVDEILDRHGKQGLYANSLFRFRTRTLDALNPAIELGRSFVRVEYQRSFFTPLLLLWRGIGRFIARSPRYAVLFGPVSISNSYDPLSRQLIVNYLNANSGEPGLARHVKPRRPFRASKPADRGDSMLPASGDIEELSRAIERIEPDHKGVPILLKHYLKLGGRVLGFNTDEQFGDALDGLIVVDLRASDPRILARYMGEDGAAGFLACHGAAA